ncbi:cytochrome P450 307a1-like [Uranotaenia lowii]|uniref:cytochrome P450 307a1-like n=1 Tax=Uranotaenia lowii TaxID=190385 RepID=UPI002479D1D8|nr:cytochrome P450 307a1-like [Uranotaenia lowii]
MEMFTVLLFSSNTVYLMVAFLMVALVMILTEFQLKVNPNSDLKAIGRKIIYGQWWSVFSLFVSYDGQVQGKEVKVIRKAPGPKRFPIIGSLKELDGYEVPYEAFNVLGKKYGPVVSLKMGSYEAIVVNGIEHIKEVLINKAQSFDSRPNFNRYNRLFAGNKENSLAFCNWSEMQRVRREMLIPHSFPRNFSDRFTQLNHYVMNEIQQVLGEAPLNPTIEIKPLLVSISANVFLQYFASFRFEYDDAQFQSFMKKFDLIFYEVNQGYAADFLPFLMPLHQRNLKRMNHMAEDIRNTLLKNIINDRCEKWAPGNAENDYLDCLINYVNSTNSPKMEWETALFAFEDIIGGHCAVANFLTKTFGYIIQNEEVQQKIQAEVERTLERTGKHCVELSDRGQMPYTDAVIMESLRLISSPIVPHVASQDSEIGGYNVPKDALIFLNNYELSMSEDLWEAPKRFIPERFIQNGRVVKPDFFLPFGAGRRSCMGYKMTQLLSFSIISNLLHSYSLAPIEGHSYQVPVGSLAMPEKAYTFQITRRH